MVRDVEAPSSKTKPSGLYCHQFKVALVELGYDHLLPEPFFKPLPKEEDTSYGMIGPMADVEDHDVEEMKQSLVDLIQQADETFIIPVSNVVATFVEQNVELRKTATAERLCRALFEHDAIKKIYANRY